MKWNVSRRNFLKSAALGALGAGLAGCAQSQTAADAVGPAFKPGTYTSVQKTSFATVEVQCEFSESALTKVSYTVTESSDSDFFQTKTADLDAYCERIAAAGRTLDVDGVAGATLSSTALKDGVDACTIQAMGIAMPVAAESSSCELNPQDENYTAYSGDLSAVFSPIQIGTMSLPNRVIKSAGSAASWSNGKEEVGQAAVDLYGAMAENGVSLILLPSGVIGSYGFKPGGKYNFDNPDDGIEAIKPLVDRVHQGGAKIGLQMDFGSPVGDPAVNELTVEEIQTHVRQTGECALRFKKAGGDCIEIKGATNDGINAFVTRRWNHREDEYGPQTLENRTRFFCEMIQSVKASCGEDFPVLALMNGAEENDAALGNNDLCSTIEETKEVARLLEQAGADAIQVRVAAASQEISCWAQDACHAALGANGMTGYGTQYDYSTHFSGMLDGSHSGYGAFIPMAKAIKSVVSVPVGCASGMDLRLAPDMMNSAVANGDLDLIYMNRPLNVDPELVKKMEEGRREDVTPCMHCLHCHDSISTGNRVKSSCRANAALQNAYTDLMPEGFEPLPAQTQKNVMVIGGGPAGMEAARVAAQRGHTVTLYEKNGILGNMLSFAEGVKGSHEHIGDYREYLIQQLDKNGVTVQLNTAVDQSLVDQIKPDAVVVAVGGQRASTLESSGSVSVVSLEDAFGGAIGDKVVLLGAGVQAVDFAVYLLSKGKKVVMVHSGDASEVDAGQSGWFQSFITAHLYAHGIKVYNGASVNGVVSDGLSITSSVGLETVIPCDTVVECEMLPNTELADALSAAGYEVYAAGDCVEPYNIQRAVLNGNLAARKI